MRKLRKKRMEKRREMLHTAKKLIFAADAVINEAWIGEEVTTRDMQEKARQFFNMELTDETATLALVARLEERGYLVTPGNIRSLDA
ncbi:hypothetical protein ACIQ9R_38340 [Streptomyces sp. NPDC094447]|uniref:hypothetical protein n=1 Tax=Streptomyces sp. NPDC094447 TaxID=3366062 RepID=UPI00382B38F9